MDKAFPARLGVLQWEGITVAFDNSPDSRLAQADRLDRVRMALEALGVRPELGWAHDEESGPYTWALVANGTLPVESIEAALWEGYPESFREESFRTVVEAVRVLRKWAA